MSPLLTKQREIYHQHQHHVDVPSLTEIIDAVREAGATSLEGATRMATSIGSTHAVELSSQSPIPLAVDIKEPVSVSIRCPV